MDWQAYSSSSTPQGPASRSPISLRDFIAASAAAGLGVTLLSAACGPRTTRPPEPAAAEAAKAPAPACELPTKAPAASASLTEFAEYSWDLFVAANWPVTEGDRGVPDCSQPIGAAGPTVWESYKTVEQIFLAGAKDPGPWNSPMTTAVLNAHAKAPHHLPLESAIQEAVGGWLIDQQSNPTYYQVAVDKTSYEYVRSHQYYNADVLNGASSVLFPNGALEVKGAWRIMENADASRYHTMAAQVMTFDGNGNPTGRYEERTVGLVGLHIVYKVSGFPQWMWATFEQVDNAPDASSPTGAWSYFNSACTGPNCTPNVSPQQGGIPFGTPNPITRVSPIRDEIAAINARRQGQLSGTPFQYYQLIAPQWPADPNDPGNPEGSPTPGTVANAVMESYIQPTSSCMACHSTARTPNDRIKTDYSFIFLFAQSPSSGSR